VRAEQLIADGQRSGEVRQGPVEGICPPALTTMHGFASLPAGGMLTTEKAESGLDHVIVYIRVFKVERCGGARELGGW
jgi:hypothetical protein